MRTPTEASHQQEAEKQPRTNGLNEEQLQTMVDAAGRYKDDPGFLERWSEGVDRYRRKIQRELERELAERERK